jgi:hypothetical protein
MKIAGYDFDFYSWIKGAEIVELDSIDTSHDPVRPELSNEFRKAKGRKIFGLQYNNEIEGVICIAYTDEIPSTVKELDLMSHEDGKIAIAYTVWSLKKGAGKKIMEELLKFMRTKGNIETIMTLSPLTPMATHYHIRNGARLIHINPTTQNFEYKL